jgi:phosphatidylglycerophosphate synthase
MLDGYMRRIIDPPLDRMGRALAARGVAADAVTLAGLLFGVAAAACVALRQDGAALVLVGLSRLADGLDGAVARATRRTDFGGFLDIACDFVFYGAVPLAFAWRNPGADAVAAAFLLFTFYVNGATFLAYAAMAARRGFETATRGVKSIYFTAGLVEGSETIAAFVVMLLKPDWFAAIATAFGAMTLATAASRIVRARAVFNGSEERQNPY